MEITSSTPSTIRNSQVNGQHDNLNADIPLQQDPLIDLELDRTGASTNDQGMAPASMATPSPEADASMEANPATPKIKITIPTAKILESSTPGPLKKRSRDRQRANAKLSRQRCADEAVQ